MVHWYILGNVVRTCDAVVPDVEIRHRIPRAALNQRTQPAYVKLAVALPLALLSDVISHTVPAASVSILRPTSTDLHAAEQSLEDSDPGPWFALGNECLQETVVGASSRNCRPPGGLSG